MQESSVHTNFIEDIINEDIASGRVADKVHTRFPPEPNGYLHIGHAKALCIDFGIAKKYGGQCNLRFDDTNPTKEDTEYVEAIQRDIKWLGFEWAHLYYASDFFDKLFDIACDLIKKGVAYVDDLTPEQMREYRGTLTQPGKNSPNRDRPIEENLDLFKRMKAGAFPDGKYVLRAKIDMASPNLIMRDPTLYRILRHHHHRTGDRWCIYPMYDFQHPLQDAIEGITHSLCSLEYEIHRPLYDWVVNQAGFEHPPRQVEFARLNITNTVMSKRYLRRLVEEHFVDGWDDPRMPTLVGMRRRGYSADAIRDFLERVGVAKADSTVDERLLEHCVREDLNSSAYRAMAVLDPLKVTITNWSEGETMDVEMENHPDHPEWGMRVVKFGRELYIEREDFMEEPPKKFFRLAPGREVRLKGAYIIKCDEVVKDESGNVIELKCSADLDSKSGSEGAQRKVKGTLHWVAACDCADAEVRLYSQMLNLGEEEVETASEVEGDELNFENGESRPAKRDFTEMFNPESKKVLKGVKCERSLLNAKPGDKFQFLRMGYFCVDPDSREGAPVFNRIVALKDTWAKEARK